MVSLIKRDIKVMILWLFYKLRFFSHFQTIFFLKLILVVFRFIHFILLVDILLSVLSFSWFSKTFSRSKNITQRIFLLHLNFLWLSFCCANFGWWRLYLVFFNYFFLCYFFIWIFWFFLLVNIFIFQLFLSFTFTLTFGQTFPNLLTETHIYSITQFISLSLYLFFLI